MLLYYEAKQSTRYLIRNLILTITFIIISFFLVFQSNIYLKSVFEIEKAKESFPTIATVRLPDRTTENGNWVPEHLSIEELNIFRENPYVLNVDDRVMMSGISLGIKNNKEQIYYVQGRVEDYSTNYDTIKISIDIPDIGSKWNASDRISLEYQMDVHGVSIIKGQSYYIGIRDSNNKRIVHEISLVNEQLEHRFLNSQTISTIDGSVFGLVFTKDVNGIYSLHKNFISISSGRNFDEMDYINQETCIVHEDVAQSNDIKVGDVIQFRFSNEYSFLNSTPVGRFYYNSTEWNIGLGQVNSDNNQNLLFDLDTVMEELPLISLTVVGTYSNKQDRTLGKGKGGEDYVDSSTIIIPYSTREALFAKLGLEDDKIICDQFISLTLRTGYEEQFYEYLNENGFDEERFQIFIDDSNFSHIKSILESMRDNAFRYVIVFICAILTIIILYVYLYIEMNIEKYTIMKRLGVPKKKSKVVLYLSMSLNVLSGVMIGSISGYLYTSSTLLGSYEKTLIQLYGEDFNITHQNNNLYRFDNTLPVGYSVIIAIGIVLVLTMVYIMWFHKMDKEGNA